MSELRARVDSEKSSASPQPRFVVDDTEAGLEPNCYPNAAASSEPEGRSGHEPVSRYEVQPNLLADAEGNSWRSEVSERLHRYQARRRPRGPRYPSLRLRFEGPERTWTSTSPTTEFTTPSQPSSSATSPIIPAAGVSQAAQRPEEQPPTPSSQPVEELTAAIERVVKPHSQETTAKIIEFPRYVPPSSMNDLADSIMDRPRIVEVPEVVPPPPALGGILIEESHERPVERQLGIDMPLQSVDLDQRLLAAAIDAVVVLAAAAGFDAIFYRLSGIQPALPLLAVSSSGLIALLWMAYQYLLVVYSGTTPGWRAMRLRLQRFDGRAPDRRIRRWRVLGSILSAITLGMGYAWLFLDEDRLCWHERVTKTYLAREEQR